MLPRTRCHSAEQQLHWKPGQRKPFQEKCIRLNLAWVTYVDVSFIQMWEGERPLWSRLIPRVHASALLVPRLLKIQYCSKGPALICVFVYQCICSSEVNGLTHAPACLAVVLCLLADRQGGLIALRGLLCPGWEHVRSGVQISTRLHGFLSKKHLQKKKREWKLKHDINSFFKSLRVCAHCQQLSVAGSDLNRK